LVWMCWAMASSQASLDGTPSTPDMSNWLVGPRLRLRTLQLDTCHAGGETRPATRKPAQNSQPSRPRQRRSPAEGQDPVCP
jgi:hypothetical protein